MFSKQEQMRTFPIYDASIEVSNLKQVIDCDSKIYRIMHPRLGRLHFTREKGVSRILLTSTCYSTSQPLVLLPTDYLQLDMAS